MKVWLPTIRAGSGVDVFVDRLAAGLSKAGHEPVVQWFSSKFEPAPWLLSGVAAPPQTDIVHASSWHAFAFRRRAIPLVVTEHHYIGHPSFVPCRTLAQSFYHELLIRRFVFRSYAAADALVAVSHSTAAAVRSDVHGKPIIVIPNWIDAQVFSPASERSDIASPHKPFRLLFVGNPSRRKGSDFLAPLARRLGKEFEIVCLGGLRSGPAIRDAPPNLIAHPRTEPAQMPDVYRNTDAVLVLARYEAFGYVALEAMACGIPVIGFDSTGTAEVCVNGETALLASVGDLDAIAGFARRLAADEHLHEFLSRNGRERAKRMFGEQENIAAYVNAYKQIIRQHERLRAS